MRNAVLSLYDAPDHPNVPSDAVAPAKPRWDAATGELWWLGAVVRSFRDDAVNQRAVLAAFEKAGGPRRIPDPLPAKGRRNAKKRRWQTVQSLKRGMPPETVRFSADGIGGFRWDAFGYECVDKTIVAP